MVRLGRIEQIQYNDSNRCFKTSGQSWSATSFTGSPRHLPASATHFFMNASFAAPASGLPFFPTALLSHVVEAELVSRASHFFINDVFAAPVSGLPFLLTA
jgi:hypothetical protein